MPRAKNPRITADTIAGKILLALRAGRIYNTAMRERFKSDYCQLLRLIRAGLVEKHGSGDDDVCYQLTELGKQACPSRRNQQPAGHHASAARP